MKNQKQTWIGELHVLEAQTFADLWSKTILCHILNSIKAYKYWAFFVNKIFYSMLMPGLGGLCHSVHSIGNDKLWLHINLLLRSVETFTNIVDVQRPEDIGSDERVVAAKSRSWHKLDSKWDLKISIHIKSCLWPQISVQNSFSF